jgi:hypothetical protein
LFSFSHRLRRPFFWWPPYGWIILGVVAFGVIVYSSISDADGNATILLRLYQEQFNPREIKDKELRSDVEGALEYQRRIEVQIREQRAGHDPRPAGRDSQSDHRLGRQHLSLALRVDRYRQDDLLARERDLVPREIQQLEAQRQNESNAATLAQLDQVLTGKRKQWRSLADLDARMTQAALQLEQSLTALATIYSQIQLIDAQDVSSGRAERLQADISDQVAQLNDLVSSINEVYDYGSKGMGSGWVRDWAIRRAGCSPVSFSLWGEPDPRKGFQASSTHSLSIS